MIRTRFLVLTGIILLAAVPSALVPAVEPTSATVPLVLDHNRITVEARLGARRQLPQSASRGSRSTPRG